MLPKDEEDDELEAAHARRAAKEAALDAGLTIELRWVGG